MTLETTLDNFEIPDLTEFEEKPPIANGKIVKIEIKEELDYNQINTIKNLHIYILDKENEFIQHAVYKISKSTKSKYYKFIKALNETNKKATAQIKTFADLLGSIYKWEYKTETYNIGGEEVQSSYWIPTEYIEKEPVTVEEEEKLKEFMKPKDDELTKEFTL